jgi:hypothetical protein
VGLYPLPSGAKFCRVDGRIKLGFDAADQYCKDSGFTGLAEPETDSDVDRIIAIMYRKF